MPNHPVSKRPLVVIHCDGGARPNPGIGGIGVVMTSGERRREISRRVAEDETTSQRAEIHAAIAGLVALKQPSDVVIVSDSKYLINCASGAWAKRINLDLWGQLQAAMHGHHITWKWVKGHASDPDNIRADELASEAILAVPVSSSETP